MFSWLAPYIERALEYLPRFESVLPTQRASCWWFMRWPREKGPGIYLVWPLVQHWNVHPVVSQICESAIVSVTDASGEAWKWRLVVEYSVHDVVAYDTTCYSAQNHLEQLAGNALVNILSAHTTEQLIQISNATICQKIKDRIAEKSEPVGITVIAVRSVMAVKCISVFLSNAERLADG
jgi:regulator of protease activity HflC (stomatin/prohibitin superfamily)